MMTNSDIKLFLPPLKKMHVFQIELIRNQIQYFIIPLAKLLDCDWLREGQLNG